MQHDNTRQKQIPTHAAGVLTFTARFNPNQPLVTGVKTFTRWQHATKADPLTCSGSFDLYSAIQSESATCNGS
ncbi:hypothetical protein [Ammoniphilus oxalaticus]|uniref:hypothetical protein n=1 Tax=Ammoniphilus oxalaticus TaxID=66863 RepID=UPI0011C40598|nr:hypothetical protein [Ammoniphilus oxalaticus]